MRHALILSFCLLAGAATAQDLRIGDDGRHIVNADGSPFFWLGDTAWELFHRLDREEAGYYLENRAAKGFTVIQAVVLAEFDGLTEPNRYGALALVDQDPTRPNEAYFQHVDAVVDRAAALGLYIGMLPTWGDKFNRKWGVGPEVFTPANARAYGEFLGRRYRNKPVIWILGGDRPPEEEDDFAIIRAMAEGLAAGDEGRHLMTYHPSGGYSSSRFFQEDGWLDIHMFQSGHGEIDNPNYRMTSADYGRTPVRPVLDGEPNYEDHPINWRAQNGWFDAFDSRRAGYWSMLAGAMGHTYGNHNVWQFLDVDRHPPVSVARTMWREALDYPGAFQAGYMRQLFESRPWQLLQPATGQVKDAPNTGGRTVMAAAASDGSFLIAYTPFGDAFAVSLESMQAPRIRLWWFNPALGTAIPLGERARTDVLRLDPPADPARGNDWVLVVDDARRDFPEPGKK
ncbi:MAG: DUF4038 domain-containing protein [Rhodothermales bacterium]